MSESEKKVEEAIKRYRKVAEWMKQVAEKEKEKKK